MQTSAKPVVGFSELKIKSQFLLQQTQQNLNQSSTESTNETLSQPENLIDEPLTQEKVESVIKNYAEEKGNAGNRQLYAALIASKITLVENTINIAITNDVQLQYLNNLKQEILDTLRQLLKNKQTQLSINVSESQSEVKAFKPDDKFKLLSEKNPFLLELKKRFDLSVEY